MVNQRPSRSYRVLKEADLHTASVSGPQQNSAALLFHPWLGDYGSIRLVTAIFNRKCTPSQDPPLPLALPRAAALSHAAA